MLHRNIIHWGLADMISVIVSDSITIKDVLPRAHPWPTHQWRVTRRRFF